MSRWWPGDVAMVRPVDALGEHLAHRVHDGWQMFGGAHWYDSQVTDARPLVVIDPEDREQVERLHKSIIRIYGGQKVTDVVNNTALMQAALREFANPTPPKPDEPMGLGAVVEDAEGVRWLRHEGGIAPWHRGDGQPNDRSWRYYNGIDAVTVLSPGVTQ